MSAYEGTKPYIFLSYSHADSDTVLKAISWLNENHFRYWYDEGIKTGAAWADFICEKIKKCSQFVVFISDNAVVSENVKDEIHIAHKYTKNTLVVYLNNVKLEGGLELYLDRLQAIKAYGDGTKHFESRLLSGLSEDCMEINFSTPKAHNPILDKNTAVSRYVVNKELLQKGMKRICVATDTHTGKSVLMKQSILDKTYKSNEAVGKLMREKEVLSYIRCPLFPAIIDYISENGNIYLIEEFIDGIPLSQDIEVSIDGVLGIIMEVIHGLKYLHNGGYVHCDIKPHNIIMNDTGDVFLVDFDTAQTINGKPGKIYGTRGFSAPEISGYGFIIKKLSESSFDKKISPTIDVYSLGMTMYYLLTKNYPENLKDIIKNNYGEYVRDETHLIDDFSENNLQSPEIKDGWYYYYLDGNRIPDLMLIDSNTFDSDLNFILHKMIAIDPTERYGNLESLENDLAEYIDKRCHKSDEIHGKRKPGRLTRILMGSKRAID